MIKGAHLSTKIDKNHLATGLTQRPKLPRDPEPLRELTVVQLPQTP